MRLSLRLRSFAAAILALLFFIPLTAITLERAFTNSLSQSMLEQLRIQNLTLISEFEMQDDGPQMPEQMFNDKLNIPDSGLYAFIQINNETAWQSLSSLNWQQAPQLLAPVIGQEQFRSEFKHGEDFFLFSYTAEFEHNGNFVPVSFFILQNKETFEEQRRAFANTLWYWLGLIAVLLLALLLFSLTTALRPINTLIEQINQAEKGQTDRITQAYPPELEKLKHSINHLLDTEQQQRARYKNSLSDLAHSLKTPLAVINGINKLPRSALEPLQQIDNIIQRQLKRAVAGSSTGWEQAVSIFPIAKKLVSAMAKVHGDKQLDIQMQLDEKIGFKGDETDLMELLGNLLDNACKAAQSKVVLSAQQTPTSVVITVEDDGPGIAPEHREALLNRGQRLDSYQEGHGIGMAVVADLVTAYQGQLEIKNSPIGGAAFIVRFPL